MGLLDDDVPPMLPSKGKWRPDSRAFEPESNFADLQNLGHERNSDDFRDSPFADRKPEDAPEQI
jgi:hypothetical protein